LQEKFRLFSINTYFGEVFDYFSKNTPLKGATNRRSLDENPRPEAPLAKKLMVGQMKNVP